MNKNIFGCKFIGLILVLFLLVITTTSDVPAQSAYEPKLNHSACVYHCFVAQNILHSKLGYEAAFNAYDAFMTRFWGPCGCEGVGFQDVLEAAIAVSGAPGGRIDVLLPVVFSPNQYL